MILNNNLIQLRHLLNGKKTNPSSKLKFEQVNYAKTINDVIVKKETEEQLVEFYSDAERFTLSVSSVLSVIDEVYSYSKYINTKLTKLYLILVEEEIERINKIVSTQEFRSHASAEFPTYKLLPRLGIWKMPATMDGRF